MPKRHCNTECDVGEFRIRKLCSRKRVKMPSKKRGSPGFDIKLDLIVRLHFGSSGEYGVTPSLPLLLGPLRESNI